MVRSFKLTANKQAALSKSNLRDAEIANHHSTFTVQYSLFVCLFVYLSVYLYVSCSVRCVMSVSLLHYISTLMMANKRHY